MDIKFIFVLNNSDNMKIENKITLTDDNLLSSLKAFIEFQKKFYETEKNNKVTTVDFLKPTFISPLLTVLIKTFLSNKEVKLTGMSSYMEYIRFENTLFSNGNDNLEDKLKEYHSKSYLPLVSFPAEQISIEEKGSITKTIENLLTKNTVIPSNIVSAIKYMIAEISDNILEHSSATQGFIYAQAFPRKKFIDICIGDNGIGLLNAYKKANHHFNNDLDAMHAANDRVSAKQRPEAENRGYGLYTSKRILAKGLDGEYMMISGRCAYSLNSKEEKYYNLKEPTLITGTTVLLRVPYKPNNNFLLNNFYE